MQDHPNSGGKTVQVFPEPPTAAKPAEHIEKEFFETDLKSLAREVELWIASQEGKCGEPMIRLSVQEELFGHNIGVLAEKMESRLQKPRFKVMISCGQSH